MIVAWLQLFTVRGRRLRLTIFEVKVYRLVVCVVPGGLRGGLGVELLAMQTVLLLRGSRTLECASLEISPHAFDIELHLQHLLGGGLHVLQCLVAFCLRPDVGLRTKQLDLRVISYVLLENDF